LNTFDGKLLDATCVPLFKDIPPDPRICTPGTPGVCHLDATCTPVTPYVCSSTRPMSYRCECSQGYSGDGLTCTGEKMLPCETTQSTNALLERSVAENKSNI